MSNEQRQPPQLYQVFLNVLVAIFLILLVGCGLILATSGGCG